MFSFRKTYFPDVTAAQWNDWRWQMRNRLQTEAELERIFTLTADERAALAAAKGRLQVGITPYYASLMDGKNPACPLRITHLPQTAELVAATNSTDDPLGEERDMVVPGLVHRYPDRVLFLVLNHCATYCRYCNRARLVGHKDSAHLIPVSQWDAALEYIAANPQIRDVLISGGDPLLLADDKLDYLLRRLRAIPHVDFIRIGTKMPLVLPQRITPALVRVLKPHRVWLSVHVTHPAEFTPVAAAALNRLANAGVVMGSQTVLLRGVNDDAATMKQLMHACLLHRIRPYYLFQCDPIQGADHFRVPVETGLAIIEELRGHTTGYAVPHYVIDMDGAGKMPLVPDYVQGRDGDFILLRNYKGQQVRYYDPVIQKTENAPSILQKTAL